MQTQSWGPNLWIFGRNLGRLQSSLGCPSRVPNAAVIRLPCIQLLGRFAEYSFLLSIYDGGPMAVAIAAVISSWTAKMSARSRSYRDAQTWEPVVASMS